MTYGNQDGFQEWNLQETASVLLYVLGTSGPDRERAQDRFRRHAGRWAGISQAQAIQEVRRYGGVDEHGRLNERGLGHAATVIAQSGAGLSLW